MHPLRRSAANSLVTKQGRELAVLLPAPFDLSDVLAFGQEAEEGRFPAIDVDGVIVPGRRAVTIHPPGQEHDAYGKSPRAGSGEEARPATGSRRGSQAQAAQAGEAAHALRRVMEQDLDELREYHPDRSVSFSSSGFALVHVPVRLFKSLPYRAHILLEVPSTSRTLAGRVPVEGLDPRSFDGRFALPRYVLPDVRSWAVWEPGLLATSHHQYPDQSICAFMPGQWVLGIHPLDDLVGMLITWLGKVLHEHLLGFWPGRQHAVSLAMATRDRRNEYCGCASDARYEQCCRPRVSRMSAFELWQDAYQGRRQYALELRLHGLQPHPPFRL